MKILNLNGVVIGEGRPKICIPLTSSSPYVLLDSARRLVCADLPFDLVEWRVDSLDIDLQEITEIACALRDELKSIPLIATLRTVSEGGFSDVDEQGYESSLQALARSGAVDMIDIEAFSFADASTSSVAPVAKRLLSFCHDKGVFALLSFHDFHNTPASEDIVARMRAMQDAGADAVKVAVMPNTAEDVLTLLHATHTMYDIYADCPLITVSMGGKGTLSRFAGEVFGSAVTFAAAGNVSAPGQIDVHAVSLLLDIVHTALANTT